MRSLLTLSIYANFVIYRSTALASPVNQSVGAPSVTVHSGPEGALQGGLRFDKSLYPFVYRNESVKDTYFGVDVKDPYRWLEAPDPSVTAEFARAQNNLFSNVMAPYDTEEERVFRLTYRLSASYAGCPAIFSETQPTLIYKGSDDNFYAASRESTVPKLVFKGSLLDPTGYSSIVHYSTNADQSYLAISSTNNASDWRRVRIVAIDENYKGRLLEDLLENTKGHPEWSPDGKGFFYTYYPYKDPTSFVQRGTNNSAIKYAQLWYHNVGTKQAQDFRLLAFPGHPTWVANVAYTDDEKYLVIYVSRNEDYNKLWVIKVSDLPISKATGALDMSVYDRQRDNSITLPTIKLVDDFRAAFQVLFTDGDIFTMATNVNSTQIRIVRTNITDKLSPDQWPTLVPADDDNILQEALKLPGGAFVASYLRRMTPVLQIRKTSDGSFLQELPLPKFDTVGGSIIRLCPGLNDTDFYYVYSSTTDPGSIYRFDTARPGAVPSLYDKKRIPGGYQIDDIVTRLVTVTSKDGRVQIPMLITSRKDIVLNGLNPTLLYGYGGQNVVQPQSYSADVMAWILGYGGVYAFAAIRGGGELGLKWWNDGHGLKKQNTFDDFVSCAQYLINNKITSPRKLAIQGGSNGGLLMGAVLTQEPGLWSAVVSSSGVYDMLRLPLFGIGGFFVREYGDARRNETVFQNLLSYSPLHNVRVPGGTQQYPATLITVGDHDDRVAPLHSYKFIATLQHELGKSPGSAQANPLLMYVRPHVGHRGAPNYITYVFIARALNALWTDPRPSYSST